MPFSPKNYSINSPRYCPSLEAKVQRFQDKERHHVFLEPEGLDNDLIYPNGLGMSFPEDIQEKIVRSVVGLQEAVIIQPGYTIEYNYLNPIDIYPTTESKRISGLFLAGQINGTTGYEEAAAQGLIAGINAAFSIQGKEQIVFPRYQSYMGVMMDDLTKNGVSEPYRMFTSRSEYRISLRPDNADQRVTALGIKHGIISQQRRSVFQKKMEKIF